MRSDGPSEAGPLRQKTYGISHFKASEDESGVAEMIVNVFNNVDSYNERSKPGCFKASLQRKKPKGVWMHDWSRPVAITLAAEELAPGDERLPDAIKSQGGLWIKGHFNLNVQDGRDAYEHLKFGTVDEFSIGYYEVETVRAKDGVTDILEVDLVEWSPVLKGACPQTQMTSIKSAKGPQTPGAPMRVKSQYLGGYAEGSAAVSAIESLVSNLFWYVLYDAFYDYEDEGDMDARLAEIEGAFNELRDIALRICRAIFEGAEGAETPQEAAEQTRLLCSPPESANEAASLAGAAYQQQVKTALAAVEDCLARGQAIHSLRAKDGRSLSPERRSELETLKTRLETLLAETRPAHEVARIKTFQLRQIQRNAARRAAGEFPTL
jgi:HK97 family phage prohead protease